MSTTTSSMLRLAALAAFAAFLATTPASAGLIINLTFDGTIATNFGANAVAMENAVTYAAQQYENLFSDPIHVNINVSSAPGTSILGQSSTFLNSVSYATLRNAVINDAKSSDDATIAGAGGDLPAANPISDATYWVSTAQSKALGITPDNGATDGTVTFGAGFSYTFDPNSRAVAGEFDFIGVAEHELSEVMGRLGISGGTIGSTANSYSLIDLYDYSGSGTRNATGFGGSFSVDNGNTLLKAFNTVSGGDTRDWQSGTNDSYNAFSNSGVKNDISATDIRVMDVLGYDLAVPEPSTTLLVLSALIVGGGLRKKLARR
ncbi:MAG TPA: NF038122 family metalloprotease, partial [Verrucomicrobiae bacterium]|nr:NF038122 family metalloprotease [Verrucomicrobiae bacterium]